MLHIYQADFNKAGYSSQTQSFLKVVETIFFKYLTQNNKFTATQLIIKMLIIQMISTEMNLTKTSPVLDDIYSGTLLIRQVLMVAVMCQY